MSRIAYQKRARTKRTLLKAINYRLYGEVKQQISKKGWPNFFKQYLGEGSKTSLGEISPISIAVISKQNLKNSKIIF